MQRTLIKEAKIVNEGKIIQGDVLICGDRIELIADSLRSPNAVVVAAKGLFLLPGVIDDQVHFREPGLTHKGTLYSESRAAVAGGVTSIMDMPNTIPNTLTLELLEDKFTLASKTCCTNYSFFMGINAENLEEALRIDNTKVCGLTDDGLYFNADGAMLANKPEHLEKLFSRTASLVALHSEDDSIIRHNIRKYKKLFGRNIPVRCHPLIRSEEACLSATKRVLEMAKKHNARLHLLHISTLAEASLFDNTLPAEKKRITAEACVHHLSFSSKDYERFGNCIKWNPSIKTEIDKEGLLASLLDDRLDIIATDHAPHSIAEKKGNYFKALSGGPLVQHSLPAMLELYHEGKLSLEKIVEKMSHAVAAIYKIENRGYIREGYFADLALVDLNDPWTVHQDNLLYKCKWSPFMGKRFKSRVVKTFVNGNLAYSNGKLVDRNYGMRLSFQKFR